MILPLILADLLFGRPGYVISHKVNWRLAPKWGLFTPAKVIRIKDTGPAIEEDGA